MVPSGCSWGTAMVTTTRFRVIADETWVPDWRQQMDAMFRECVRTFIHSYLDDHIDEWLAPPKNWRWFHAFGQPLPRLCPEPPVLAQRPIKPQARACKLHARRWKRRRFLHTLQQ